MIRLEGGRFRMGSNAFYPDEAPERAAEVATFELDQHPVTNAQFAEFVADTDYLTVAERALDPAEFPGLSPGELVAGALVFTPTRGPVDLRDWRQWWSWQPGADWRHPFGADSGIAPKRDHPVVQVAFEDAAAYAAWAGKRLATEAEFEFAARGGNQNATAYAWGDEPRVNERLMANTWQGRFPYLNTGANGWVGTSPVGSFPANGYGIHDLIGNVWEWTSTYYSPRYDASLDASSAEAESHAASIPGEEDSCSCSPTDDGRRARSMEPGSSIPRRALKGGSHLCAPEYCLRYRPAARSPQADDTATTHIGFRCARDAV
jgi:formylglycine-generating enzyme